MNGDFWPLTAVQTLLRARGYSPNDGWAGVNYDKGDRNATDELQPIAALAEGIDIEAVREYWAAVCENSIRNLIASQNALAKEHSEGRVGDVSILPSPTIQNEAA